MLHYIITVLYTIFMKIHVELYDSHRMQVIRPTECRYTNSKYSQDNVIYGENDLMAISPY